MEGQVFGGRVGPGGIRALPWEETAFVAPSSPVQGSFLSGCLGRLSQLPHQRGVMRDSSDDTVKVGFEPNRNALDSVSYKFYTADAAEDASNIVTPLPAAR